MTEHVYYMGLYSNFPRMIHTNSVIEYGCIYLQLMLLSTFPLDGAIDYLTPTC